MSKLRILPKSAGNISLVNDDKPSEKSDNKEDTSKAMQFTDKPSSVTRPEMKTVTALKFTCKHCKRVFTTFPGITKHMNIEHKIIDESPLLQFTTHPSSVPRPVMKTVPALNFTCKHCMRTFKTFPNT